ncbi:MAG: hypothetical protein R2882_12935 [Gemmatimonadales bacterium]
MLLPSFERTALGPHQVLLSWRPPQAVNGVSHVVADMAELADRRCGDHIQWSPLSRLMPAAPPSPPIIRWSGSAGLIHIAWKST